MISFLIAASESSFISEFALGFGSLFHLLLSTLVILHILRRPRDSRTALLWIFFVTSFPFVGVIAYILFGINTTPKKGWAKRYSDAIFVRRERTSKKKIDFRSFQLRENLVVPPEATEDPPFNRLLDQLGPEHPLTKGNHIEALYPAAKALEEMFEAIRNAKHHIHLATYILADDEIGRRLLNLLTGRAKAGVSVRVLYDAFGSAGPELRGFFRSYRKRKIPNLHLAAFSQSNILKRQFQLNLRNHRKILVIDGRMAFTGGVNFHRVYLKDPEGRPGTVDYHFRLQGPAVIDLQFTFLRDWFYTTDEPIPHFYNEEYYPQPKSQGDAIVRVLDNNPLPPEITTIQNLYVASVNRAKEQILIVTPYFVPTEALMLALCQAARRGVDIKILVPAANNHPTIRIASQAIYQPLLFAGVRLFERRPPFIHAKAMLIDDVLSIIGSSNLDPRSLVLNYETNLQLESVSFAQRLKEIMLSDFAAADEITYRSWKNRSAWHKFIENFFFLFHPIA